MDIRALLFDVNGTLIDIETDAGSYAEWDAVARWRELLQRKATDYTRSLPPEKLEQLPLFLAELHRGIARKRLRLYPQVQEVLDQLRPHYRMAVVSDAQSAYAVPELHAVGL